MVEIKHICQEKDGHNWKCGQACLEMIFDYYGIKYDPCDIWENIKEKRESELGQYFSPTYKMAHYSIEHGLNATIYKANEDTYLEVLKQINNLGIPAILLIRQDRSGRGHFVVYKGIKNKMFYYCDPDSNRDFDYFRSSSDIKNHWKLQYDVAGYIFVVFDLKCDETISCQKCGGTIPIVYPQFKLQIEGIACSHCGEKA